MNIKFLIFALLTVRCSQYGGPLLDEMIMYKC